jgi:hypothetical protein
MTASLDTEGRGGTLAIDIAGAASTAAGGIGSVLNPWGEDVLILRATLYVATPSTGSANIDIGVGSAAATDATDIINALAMNGAITGKVYNGHAMQNTTKTEITAPVVWQDDYYVCFTGSATTAGLVAKLFLECVPLT